MPFAKIHIENLGPIREGTFELRPLTIFIGPNNSGKTYAATAAYAMVNGLAFERRYRRERLAELSFGGPHGSFAVTSTPDYGQLLPDDILNGVRRQVETILARATDEVLSGLLDAFATDNAAQLRPDRDFSSRLEVSLLEPRTGEPMLGVRADSIAGTTFNHLDPKSLSRLGTARLDRTSAKRLIDGFPDDDIANELWGDMLDELGLPLGDAHYLPAARLGIIQGWTVLAASAIGSLRQRAGRLRDQLSPIGGVYADYLSSLVSLGGQTRRRTDYPEHFAAAAQVLETEIIKGRIVIESTTLGVIRIVYRTEGFDLPLDQASSTVADMAPLAIVMKEQLSIGDLLVIDEPEAHLHPENERRIARVLARVASAGVRVLVPTHSSTLLHQISNLVRSGFLTEQERHALGHMDDERLRPDDVGVYQFRQTDDGVVIEEVRYDPEFGYSEEEFYDVAEDISRESYQIESRLPAHAG